MKIVIDINENIYHRFINGFANEDDAYLIEQLFKNGTSLPKGHGRLIDADETLKAMNTWDKFGFEHTGCFVRNPEDDFIKYVHYDDMVKAVSGTPTIIDADKGE